MLRLTFLIFLLVQTEQQLLTSVADVYSKLLNGTFNPFYILRKEYYPAYANIPDDKPSQQPALRASRKLQFDACGPGLRFMATWNETKEGFDYPISTIGYVCYCPYDYSGPSCENHVTLMCNTKFTSVQNPPFPSMIGEMQLDCKDYTGYMAYEGVKPNPQNGKIPQKQYIIDWGSNTLFQDMAGNPVTPPANSQIFNYSDQSGPFSFTNSIFYVETKLISWVNTAQTLSLCIQPLSASNLAGQPFSFNCTFDHEKYQQYQPYGVYSLESSVIENQNNRERFHQTSMRSLRWNINNPNYVQKGNWRSTKTYSIWVKIMGAAITIAVLMFVWKQFQKWRNHKSTMHELRQSTH